MSKIEQILLKDVSPGDILANDLFVNRQLLMKKDSTLTEKGIELLRKKGVQFVTVYYQEKMHESNDTTQHYLLSNELSKNDIVFNFSNIPGSIHSTDDIALNFYSLLAELDMDIRYGQILKDASAIDYLQNLLEAILSNDVYKNYLDQLKAWDYTSYLHSIDAFILGTLFARKLKLEQLEQIAIGYLLHDIGKLNIPKAILQKPGRLNAKEFDLMKSHTLEGEAIFNEIGLSQWAYLAKSHHERRNGEGYPGNSTTTFTIELEILQIIDVYSAITMKRTYRDAMRAADAFSLLYRDQVLFNELLLTQFVDFIGIYPENSIVLLSDNFHAIVEKANPKFPTSPRVKCIETGISFHISVNNEITITKMISHQSESKAALLNTFYNELVSANVENAKKTYLKLVDNFNVSEYFTKIFIPVYQILNLLKRQQTIYDSKYAQVVQYMEQLMEQKIEEQIDNDHYEKNVLFLVESNFKNDYLFKAFLGLVHNEHIFPHVLTIDSSLDSILMTIDTAHISETCVITDTSADTLLLSYLPNTVELSTNRIERYLLSLIGETQDVFHFDTLLQEYATNQILSI
ncbi:HD domain-containing phosphohydrolase [Solibacillus sp. FSL R7-0682]|uniref:HD-GYP domain-containing protein n=1 Tax=Solibacillus sp. FSL R7-0682 TaxID=2921690 RepID=UPI0030FAB4EF